MSKIRNKRTAEQVEASAKKGPIQEPQTKPSRRNLLSTGSTLLNLACSDNPFGGFLKGKYYFMVGDSTSGKTFLSMTCLAEASGNRHFKDYRFIYDNAEDGCLLDIERLFNKQMANRLEPPAIDEEGLPIYSNTIEEFYYHLDDAIEEGAPFIYILDSMDSLSSSLEEEKFRQHKDAHRKNKATPGSYGDGKAKKSSEGLRKVLKGLRNTGSILIILCQTRDNIGGYGGKTRSGGHALRFYATVEIWSSVKRVIKKTVKGRERKIGVNVNLLVRKNRITGKLAEVNIDIFPSYGIDDIGSLIDFLIEENWWGTKKQSVCAKEFGLTASRDKVISHIEERNLTNELVSIAGRCWKRISEESALKRKKRYGGQS